MSQSSAERLETGVAPLLRRVETPLPRLTRQALAVADLCATTPPAADHGNLLAAIGAQEEGHRFEHRLTRGGWYRLGGIVTADRERVAVDAASWAEREAAGDVLRLLARHGESDLFATRLTGRTHYFVASTGEGPLDFLQLEVEELQEVLDRQLLPEGWIPDNVEELLDPVEYEALSPIPVGPPRYQFRRLFSAGVLVRDLTAAASEPLPLARFVEDWQASSAAEGGAFSDHWVLFVRETVDRYGDPGVSAKPVPVACDAPVMDFSVPPRGAELANLIHGFDRKAGYPFAWYFWMLTSRRVPHALAEAVHRDLMGAYAYLPPRDLKVLGHWSRQPYCV